MAAPIQRRNARKAHRVTSASLVGMISLEKQFNSIQFNCPGSWLVIRRCGNIPFPPRFNLGSNPVSFTTTGVAILAVDYGISHFIT